MANSWAVFKELINDQKKWIGMVVTTNDTTKRVTVRPIGSSTNIEVQSNGANFLTGSYVYIVGDTATGQAPQIAEAHKEIIS